MSKSSQSFLVAVFIDYFTLPSVVEHNASRVFEDNKVLEWDIIPTMNNIIEIRFRIPNRDRIILGALVSCCLILLIYMVKRKSTLEQ